jgi:hypothetical protein
MLQCARFGEGELEEVSEEEAESNASDETPAAKEPTAGISERKAVGKLKAEALERAPESRKKLHLRQRNDESRERNLKGYKPNWK